MQSDSLVYFGRGRNTQAVFIGHVRYRDSTITMDAERGTYFRNGERWEARGNVVTTNLVNGITMKGPSLDYYRAIPGIRDTAEAYAIGRPTINSYPQDTAGERGEPYVVVADRVRLKGNDPTRDHALQARSHGNAFRNLEPLLGQQIRALLRRLLDLNVFLQPLQGNPQWKGLSAFQNCWRNRR